MVGGIALIVVPAARCWFDGRLGPWDDFTERVKDNQFAIPAPPARALPTCPSLAQCTASGRSRIRTCQRSSRMAELGELAARGALAMVASIGGTISLHGLVHHRRHHHWHFGESGAQAAKSILGRIVGSRRGGEFAALGTSTIRAVALGVVGVAFIQAMAVGIIMILAQVPFAGVLAVIMLVLGVAQVPALLVTVPVIAYVWLSKDTRRCRPSSTRSFSWSPACSTTC